MDFSKVGAAYGPARFLTKYSLEIQELVSHYVYNQHYDMYIRYRGR